MAVAGGVRRDSNSKFIRAFTSFLGVQISVIAEAKAILLGLRIACLLRIPLLWIEKDSQLFISILNDMISIPVNISYIVRDIK